MRQRYSKHYSSPRQIIGILKNERGLLFNEIEKIEVAVRSVLISDGCTELGDDFWITNPRHFIERRNFNQTRRTIKIDLAAMGFPADWQTEPLWRG